MMLELKNKVDELTLTNEYNLRLKDMTYAERIKEVNEKFQQELEHQKGRLDILREEKSDLEMEYDDRLKQMEEKHRHELQEIENEYQHKVGKTRPGQGRRAGERGGDGGWLWCGW